jgi:recombination protein RecR
MEQLPSLQNLLKFLQQVPYLASKNLYRVAHHFLEMNPERRAQFIAAFQHACEQTQKCDTCCSWREKDRACYWCTNARRNQRIICVIETWHDLCAIERAGGYQGTFHVLGGVLSPLDGVGPEDLAIDALVKRVTQGTVEEVILAMNPTLEGESTALFIARKLKDCGVRITCLSRGLPTGWLLESMDKLTVGKAVADRRVFEGSSRV